jgi:peptidyl-prolyl cis-trans isomerase D
MIAAMLQFFHRVSTSTGARFLFAILLFAFVIFGIGDVLRQRGGDSTVATIAGEDITTGQLTSAFDNVLHSNKIDPAMAKKFGVLDNVLDNMINDTLARRAALDDGIVVSKAQILDMLGKLPQLRDEKTGKIDRQKFELLLQTQHWSEADLVNYFQNQAMVRVIGEADLAQPQPPQILVDALYGFAREQRRGEIVRITNASMTIPTPTQDQLMAYYHAHESSYMAPEYRSFSFITVSPDVLAKGMKVAPEDVKKEYDAHADKFGVPERRDVVQVMAPDEAKAKAVVAAVKGGKSLADAAKAAGLSAAPQDMGPTSLKDLPQPLQGPVFAAKAGDILDPIQTPFGWDVISVPRIEPGHVLPFDQVRDSIASDMQAAQAHDKLADDAKQIDDQLSGGASLADAGKPLGIAPVQVDAVDEKGQAANGGPAAALKGHEDILAAVFQASKDASPQIEDAQDGSVFAFQVTNIVPPALKPFDSVKADVLKAYVAEAKAAAAKAKAADELKRYQGGTPFAALAKDANVIPLPMGPVTRVSHDKGLDKDVLKALFALAKPDEAGIADTADGPVLVRVTEIVPVKTVDAKDLVTLTPSVAEQMQQDVSAEYEQALRKAYDVKIHQDVLNEMKASD